MAEVKSERPGAEHCLLSRFLCAYSVFTVSQLSQVCGLSSNKLGGFLLVGSQTPSGYQCNSDLISEY